MNLVSFVTLNSIRKNNQIVYEIQFQIKIKNILKLTITDTRINLVI
jgi:hypothetical protein